MTCTRDLEPRSSSCKGWWLAVMPLALLLGCFYDYSALQRPGEGEERGRDAGSAGSGGGRAAPADGDAGPASSGGRGGALSRGAGGSLGGAVVAGGASGSVGGGTGGAGGSAGGGQPAGAGGGPAAGGAGSASGGAGRGGGGAGGGSTARGGAAGGVSDLVIHYKFDDGAGFSVRDAAAIDGASRSGGFASKGTGGSTGFSTDRRVGTHAVALQTNGVDGGGYVSVPALGALAPDAVTISLWVKMTSNPMWQRLFDYGHGIDRYFFLTAGDPGAFLRFGITDAGWTEEEQIISTARLVPGTWHHVAVVLGAGSPYRGLLYVDGVAAGVNNAMTLHPGDLGETTKNYLGRSQFDADPTFNGLLDDFRVYRRELSSIEILNLFATR